MAKKQVKIGILGGIGPESTGEFYTKLILEFQKRGLIKENKDFPQIVVNSIPAKELVYDNIDEAYITQYLEGIKQLDNFGVDFIVMVCNTIHLFYDKLQKEVKTPILDLREEIKAVLDKKRIKSVFIMGTPSTLKDGLYKFNGIKIIKPTKEETMEMSEAVLNFNNGTDKGLQAKKMREICDKYLSSGAEAVILGCTEFGIMFDDADIPKVNSIDVLVDATIEKAQNI